MDFCRLGTGDVRPESALEHGTMKERGPARCAAPTKATGRSGSVIPLAIVSAIIANRQCAGGAYAKCPCRRSFTRPKRSERSIQLVVPMHGLAFDPKPSSK